MSWFTYHTLCAWILPLSWYTTTATKLCEVLFALFAVDQDNLVKWWPLLWVEWTCECNWLQVMAVTEHYAHLALPHLHRPLHSTEVKSKKHFAWVRWNGTPSLLKLYSKILNSLFSCLFTTYNFVVCWKIDTMVCYRWIKMHGFVLLKLLLQSPPTF